MRTAGLICSEVLKILKDRLKPGITTKFLADIAKKEIEKRGGSPAFLGYNSFPDVICISLNNEVVHGIPRLERIIKPGDIVSLDLGVAYQGMIVDSAVSLLVDSDDHEKKRLLNTTLESLEAGVKQVHDGCKVGDISAAIESVLNKGKLGIIRDLVGHGVGHAVHEEPNIPNYGKANQGDQLKAGMTIAIEPMATLGNERVFIGQDGWTVHTIDGSNSAHFEQTVLITRDGYIILTPFL